MTRADRLNAITARVGADATYVIHTTDDGGRRVVVTNPTTGDAIGGVGATLDEALDALDAKVPAAKEAK